MSIMVGAMKGIIAVAEIMAAGETMIQATGGGERICITAEIEMKVVGLLKETSVDREIASMIIAAAVGDGLLTIVVTPTATAAGTTATGTGDETASMDLHRRLHRRRPREGGRPERASSVPALEP